MNLVGSGILLFVVDKIVVHAPVPINIQNLDANSINQTIATHFRNNPAILLVSVQNFKTKAR